MPERVQPTWHEFSIRFSADSEGVGRITNEQIAAGMRLLLGLPNDAEIVLDEATLTFVPRWLNRPAVDVSNSPGQTADGAP